EPPRVLDQPPELALEARVLRRRAAAALVAERGHRDAPAVVEAADDVELRRAGVADERLGEMLLAGHLADRPELDAVGLTVALDREQDVGDPAVLGRLRVGATEAEQHRRVPVPGGPHLLPVDDDVLAVEHALGPQAREVRAGARLREPLAVAV